MEIQSAAGKNYIMSFSDPQKMLAIKERHGNVTTNRGADRHYPELLNNEERAAFENGYAAKAYLREALSKFEKLDYNNSLKGHHQLESANTLRNSVKLAINFDSTTERFKPQKRGGHHSVSTVIKTSFDKNVSASGLIL